MCGLGPPARQSRFSRPGCWTPSPTRPPSSKSQAVAKGLMSGPGSWRDIAQSPGNLGPCFGPAPDPASGRFGRKIPRSGLDTLTPFMHSPAAFGYLRSPFDRAGRHPGACRFSGPRYGSHPIRTPSSSSSDLFARMQTWIQVMASSSGRPYFLQEEDGSPVALVPEAGSELRPFRDLQFYRVLILR